MNNVTTEVKRKNFEYTITKHKLISLSDKAKTEIVKILNDHYSEADKLFDYLNTTNNQIYLLENEFEVIGFYFFGIFHKNDYTFVHLGQSCMKREFLGNKLAIKLYKYQMNDLRNMNLPDKTIIFASTANEQVFKYSFSIYNHVRPTIRGGYSEEDLNTLKILCNNFNWESSDIHPYMIKRKNHTIRYKNEFKVDKNKSFFSNLNINEKDGDRLILILKL